jgi:hypothetical protein
MSNDLVIKSDGQDLPQKSVSMQDALLAIVQRTDIDPDRLEKFLDLQIKMENRQAERSFNEALAGFQGECPIIQRTRKVEFTAASGKTTKYNYSPLDEIVHIIKPLLDKYGLSYSFNVQAGEKSSKLLTKIRHKDGHSETTELEFETLHDDGRMNLSQRRKSAITFTKRAGLENALGIVTAEEDDDARRAIDNPATEAQIAEIEKLIIDTKSDLTKFKAAFQIQAVTDFSEFEARDAIHALKEKRAQAIRPKKDANVQNK